MRARTVVGVSIMTLFVAAAAIGVVAVLTASGMPSVDDPVRMTTTMAKVIDIGEVEQGAAGAPTRSDVDLTYAGFDVPIVFRVHGTRGGLRAEEFCLRGADRHMITLGHIMACRDDVRIIRPSRVACGSLKLDPGVEPLAEAILADPTLGAIDRGAISPGENVPAGLFATQVSGRVIDVARARADQADLDADRCRLFVDPDPGLPIDVRASMAADEASIEIDPEATARLILVQAGDRLVVIRAAAYDAGADFQAIDHMLEQIYAIRFPSANP